MNLKEWVTHLEIDKEDYLEMMDLFKKNTASDLKNLETALENREASVIERMAHSIKGAAAILGLMEICDAAKTIEKTAQMNRLEEVEIHLRVIRESFEAIGESMKGEPGDVKKRNSN